MKRTRLPSLVVYPTERHVERASDPAVTSSRRFFERLRAAIDDRPVASTPLLRLLAKRAFVKEGASPAEQAGVAAAADATLGLLARARTTASDLEATRTTRGASLAALVRDVEAEVERLGRFDARKPLGRSMSGALASASVELPGDVIVDGCLDLDAGQLDAWLAVHRAVRERGGRGVRLRVPRFEEGLEEDPVARVGEDLERRLADEPDAFDLEWFEAKRAAKTNVVEAHGDAAEARGAARAVRAALDQGARPDRILIVVPSRDEAFLEPLRAALREAGVPASEAWGAPVRQAPEARTVLSLLAMTVGRLDRDSIVELLRTPGLHPGSLVRERDEASAVDRAARLAARLGELPVVQDRDGKLFVEVLRAATEGTERDGDRDFWMVSAMEKLAENLELLRRGDTVERFVTDVLAVVERLRLGDPSASEIHQALASRRGATFECAMRAIGEGAVAVRAVREALEGIRDAHRTLGLESERADIAALTFELEQGLSSVRTAARGAAGRAGVVRIGELREALGVPHDLLVVTRLSGRGYAPPPSSTLLDEATRRALPAPRRPRSARERAIIREAELAWALASADEVTLTYSSTDDAGREAEPPHREIPLALSRGAAHRIEPASRVSASASHLSVRAAQLERLSSGEPPPADLIARVRVELDRQAFFADPSAAPGPFTGLVQPAWASTLAERVGGTSPERAVGVTFAERAFLCPFRAFADRVLRARRAEEIQDMLAPRERGDLLHKALYAAFEADRESPPSATIEARIETARAEIHRALDVDGFTSALRREGRSRTARDALLVFSDEIAAEQTFFYIQGERKFAASEPDPWGALVLETEDGGRVFIEGRIDRIDATPDRRAVRVVDYKTGRPRSKRAQNGDFQIPLYALVAKRLGAHEVSGVYVAIGPGGVATISPSKESERVLGGDALEEVSSMAAHAVLRVASGFVAPRPASLGACRRCEARDLCRRPAVMPESVEEDASSSR